jgi:hypothetical protein
MTPQSHFPLVWRRRVRRLILAGAIALALSAQVIGASAAPHDDASTNVNWNSGKQGGG